MGTGLSTLAAIDPSAVEIPGWVHDLLVPLGFALVALFVAWLVLAILGALHRRAYNLTKAETARPRAEDPSFLKVDHEAREAALARGDAYVRPADRETGEKAAARTAPSSSIWAFLCRLGVILVAVAHFGVVVVSVADATYNAERVVQDISASDRFTAIVSKYWLGLSLGAIVLAAEIVRFVQSRRAES
jgi:hypothetical protein